MAITTDPPDVRAPIGPSAPPAGDEESRHGERRRARRMAAQAVARFGLEDARVIPLEHKTNVTFRVDAAAGPHDGPVPGMEAGRYLLRLCHPGAYDRAEIASEVEWLETLRRDEGLVVPQAVAATDGELVPRVGSADREEERFCVLFRWVRGEVLEATPRPDLVERLGELAARLHRCASRFVPPEGFRRPTWTCDSLFGTSTVVPAGVGEPFVSDRIRRTLDEGAAAVREAIAPLGEGRDVFGLIHKDLEPDNTVVDRGRVRAIDFADCGWGHYLYDLGAALLPLRERRGYAELREAFLRGYQAVRPLRPEHLELLDTFLIARCLFSIRFMTLHSLDRPEVRRYAGRVIPLMVGEVRRYLERARGRAPGARDGDPGGWTTLRLLSHLRRAGVELWHQGERLRFRAPQGALTPALREELARRKEEVLAFLRQSSRAPASGPREPAIPTSDEARAPLSFAQQRLWFLDRLRPGSTDYNVSRAVLLRGDLDPAVLARCIQEIVRRHAVLRTTFAEREGEAVQEVAPSLRPGLPVLDLRGLPGPARDREVRAVARGEALRPFDLGRGPLLRLLLMRLGPGRHVIVSTMHHIVSDGWSTGVLFREIGRLYEAFARGLPSPLPALPVQYVDFARWQRRHLAGEVLDEQLRYWRGELEGAPEESPLPLDRPRSAAGPARGGRLDFPVPPPVVRRLEALARNEGATLYMVALAAFLVLLHRVSGERDVVVGSPVANRNRSEIEGLIGFFVNTLVHRSRLERGASFRELLRGVQRRMVRALEHQDVPFELLVEELRPTRRLDRNPLFQVLFMLQSAPRQGFALPGLEASFLPSGAAAAKFDLTASLQEADGVVAGAFRYRADLLDASTVARLASGYGVLLDAVGRDPDVEALRAPVLPRSLAHQVLREWNDTRTAPAGSLLVHQVVAEQARRTPEAVAVTDGNRSVSYRELTRRSGAQAGLLGRLGVGPDDLVALYLERSPELVVACLSVLEAGAGYLVLEPAGPARRLALLLADARPAVVLTRADLERDLEGCGRPVVAVDAARADPEPREPSGTRPAVGLHDLAYAVHTSGSTGTPKRVLVHHEALANHMAWIGRAYPIAATDSVVHKTPFSFDPSVGELWAPLMVGARLVMGPSEAHRDPDCLARWLARERSATLQAVPSILRELVEEPALRDWPAPRRVYCGGEPLSRELLERFLRRVPAPLCNVYGPAEAAIHATYWTCRGPEERAVPVGRPIDNARVVLLDAVLEPPPVGSVGELFIGGLGVARGYGDRPAATAAAFLPDPFAPSPGARLYRSGDLGRQRPDGVIELRGRRDDQVKVRGVRIEPGEVEAALLEHPGIREASVQGRRRAGGSPELVAYVVPAAPGAVTARELRSHLGERLPAGVVPAVFVLLDGLPRTPSGKVDRGALPPVESGAPSPAEAAVAPVTPTEEVLAEVWKEVLDREAVGVRDDFFELGGHSLLAVRVASRVRALLGVEVALRKLFEAPTVRELAALVDGDRRRASGLRVPPPAPVPRDRELPLSYAQERLWFLDRLEPGIPAYNLPGAVDLAGAVRPGRLARVFGEVVRRHEALRTTFEVRDGRPVQRVAPPGPVPLPVADLRRLPPPARGDELRRLSRREAGRAFDLREGPLFRALLLRSGPEAHRVLVTMHHVVSDGWSMGIFLRELAELYGAFARGRPSPLPGLPVQYPDYACWQRTWLTLDVVEEQLSFWRETLSGAPARLDLPTDRPHPPAQTFRGGVRPVRLGPALGQAVRSFARTEGATPFMVLLAGFQALLGRLSRQDDVSTGSPVAGRTHAELEGVIGFFVNTLVFRTDLSGRVGFRELVARVRAAALAAYGHQDLPFERLVEELAPDRDLSRHPLFQVVFALQNAPRGTIEVPGLTMRPVSVSAGTSKFDLSLVVHEEGGSYAGALEYGADLFDATSVQRLGRQLETLLRRALESPDLPVLEHPWLSRGELQQVLVEWNDTPEGEAEAEAGPVHRQVELQARRVPDAVALSAGGRTVSYGELDDRAGRLARRLSAFRLGPDAVAAVLLERSVEEVVALLAVLKSGGAYLPLDPGLPEDRLAFMLGDSGARVMLTSARLAGGLPEVPRLLVDEAGSPDGRSHGRRAAARPPEPGGGRLAYLIYTSGSTGRPKGVALHHDGLANLVRWHRRAFRISGGDRATRLSGLGFDASVWELWPYLASGATVLIPDEETRRDPEALRTWLLAEGATASFVPTPVAEELLALDWPEPAALRVLLTGGDRLHGYPRTPLPFVLVNNYGPTENTVVATSGAVPAAEDAPGAPTLGRPIDGVRVHLLDPALRPVPVGVPGEIHVGGAGVARGYRSRPAWTARSFVPSPFATEPGGRLYATGDLARLQPGGEVEFLGRVDQQVQLRGFRIEPEEIEAVLESHEAVRESVVLLREDGAASPMLVAYAVAERGTAPDPEVLREHLARSVPAYMVPAAFVLLEAFPLTRNGKIDRQALPAPGRGGRAGSPDGAATPTEEVLAALWAQVLRREEVGLDEDFFRSGGHSLLATQVVSRARDVLGVALGVRDLFERPTVRALARRVEERRQEGTAGSPPPLRRAHGRREAPASFAQERLWFLSQFATARAAYNVPLALEISGGLHLPAFARAVGEVVRRHESLRTAFETRDGRPRGVVKPHGGLPLPVVDLAGLPSARGEEEAPRLAAREARRPFDLAEAPLLRAGLVRLSRRRHVALVTLHHIASDGWSVAVLTREAARLYEAFVRGEPSPLEELPVQYGDYSRWQREWLSGTVLEEKLGYWKERLAGAPETSGLPTDRPRPAVQTFSGGSWSLVLPEELTARLHALARERGVTPFMLLLAAFYALLYRHSGRTDLVVGSPVAGRTRPELEGLIGFFVNTLVLRATVDPRQPFHDLLERVRETALGAYAHQEIPFERLVEALHGARDPSRNPLFQVAFALQNAPAPGPDAGGLRWRSLGVAHGQAKFDLTLSFQERGGRLHGSLEYSRDLFDPCTVGRWARHYERCLQEVVEDPEVRPEALALLSPAERQELVEWNAAVAPEAEAGSLPDLFRARVRERPDGTAVDGPGGALSYGELGRRSWRLACRLRRRGVRRGSIVGVCAARSADEVVAALAVLEAGAAYLPLDPAQPPERLRWMVEDAGAELVVGHWELAEAAAGERAGVVDVRERGSRPSADPEPDRPAPVGPRDLAYVIYTSGSTGRPKGVEVEHGGLAHLIRWHRRAFDLGPEDRSPHLASQGFDASVWEIWPPLAAGATLVLPPEEPGRTPPGELQAWLLDARAGVCFLPTPLAEELLALPWPEAAPLRALLTGGDRLHGRPPRGLRFRLVNNYGPTENTVVATSGPVEPAAAGSRPPPIGRPIDPTTVAILDRSGAPVAAGVPGELLLAGPSLARGYLGRPALTAESFVPDPGAASPGGRLYRTGDQARWLHHGEIEFLGRRDHQVKIRGYRVELGEIESVVLAQDGVRDCAVSVVEAGASGGRLVCHCVAEAGAEPDPRRLRELLARRLPDYMVPSELRWLDALPLNASGKVDRRALASRAAEPSQPGPGGLLPSDPLELELAGIWEEVLGLEAVHGDDDFFELGGHSLLAMRLLSRIERQLGCSLPVEALFRAPTVAGLAAEVRAAPGARREPSPLVPIRRGGGGRPLVCVHPVSGSVVCYADLARRLGPERSVYGLQSEPLQGEGAPGAPTLERMALRYADRVRAADPEGPALLLGWSMGGVIALEVARQLVLRDHPVGLVALVDAHPPEEPGARPLPPEPARIGLFLRDLAALHGHDLRGGSGELAPADPEEAWALAREALRDLGPAFRETDLEELRRRFAVFDRNLRAFRGHRPRPFPGRVVLFEARQARASEAAGARERWRGLLGEGLEVEEVPGDHYSVLRRSSLDAWIDRLRARLREAEEAAAVSAGGG